MYATPFRVVWEVLLNFRIVRRNPSLDIYKVSDERGQIAFHDHGITTKHKLIYDACLIELSHNCKSGHFETIQEERR